MELHIPKLGFFDEEINASIAVGHEWTDTNEGQGETLTVQTARPARFEQVVW